MSSPTACGCGARLVRSYSYTAEERDYRVMVCEDNRDHPRVHQWTPVRKKRKGSFGVVSVVGDFSKIEGGTTILGSWPARGTVALS